MARALTLAVAACVLAVAVATIPTFPNNWSSDQISRIAINQGGVKQPDGSICCGAETAECKVQTAFSAGIEYVWYSGNMTASLGPDGSGVVTDFNAMKEYAVNGSGYCQQYCPLPPGSGMAPGIGMPTNAVSMGVGSYNGRMLNLYQTTTKIPILNITMESTYFWVDESGPSPVPVAIIQDITPFGQKIGGQNQTFVTFTAGVPAKSHFTVLGAASCPQPKGGCKQNNGGDDDGSKDVSLFARRMLAEGVAPVADASIVRNLAGKPSIELEF